MRKLLASCEAQKDWLLKQIETGAFRFLNQELTEKEDMLRYMESFNLTAAVSLLVFVFYCQNQAIGTYAQNQNLSGSLAENELQWLRDPMGAQEFARRHQAFFRFIRGQYDSCLSSAWLFAQILLFHENAHYFLVEKAYGHTPTKQELADMNEQESDDDKRYGYRARLRLRLLLISDVDEFRRELMKMDMRNEQ